MSVAKENNQTKLGSLLKRNKKTADKTADADLPSLGSESVDRRLNLLKEGYHDLKERVQLLEETNVKELTAFVEDLNFECEDCNHKKEDMAREKLLKNKAVKSMVIDSLLLGMGVGACIMAAAVLTIASRRHN